MASSSARDVRLRGVGASPGVAVGSVLRLDERGRHQFYYLDVSPAQVRREARRLHEAFEQARAELQEIKARLTRELGYEHSFILDAKDIWPSTVAELDFNRVLGFATNSGGITSHAAIIARALGVPAVVGLHDVTRRARTGTAIIIDGAAGEVILRPNKTLAREYARRQKQDHARQARVIKPTEAAETLDGVRITLRANVELPTEIDTLARFGAEGIGLYRSEFSFLAGLPNLPGDDEQYL